MFDEKASKITTELATVQESLKTFPKEIWKELDPDDIPRIEKYTNLKREINRLTSDLDRISQSFMDIVQQFSGNTDNYKENMETATDDGELLNTLNREKAHYVDEDLTGRTPYAIILEDRPYLLRAWTNVYVQICRHFLTEDRDKMLKYISSIGKNHFADNTRAFGSMGTELETNLFVKTNLSAEEICKRIILIFDFFGFPHRNLKIFLIGDSETSSMLSVRSRNLVNLDLVP